MPHLWMPPAGPEASSAFHEPCPLQPMTRTPWSLLIAVVGVSFGRSMWACGERWPESEGQAETINLSFSAIFGKTRVAISTQPTAEKAYKLKNSVTREQEAWRRCIYRRFEKAPEILAGLKECISHFKAVSKDGEGDCYFKCKDNNATLQVTWKIKETWRHQRITIFFQGHFQRHEGL